MAFAEDLAVFFDTAQGFAVEIVFGTTTFAGIFARAGEAVLGIEATTPTLICPAAAVAEAQKGDVFTIGGEDYELAEPPRPDGTGLAELKLTTLD